MFVDIGRTLKSIMTLSGKQLVANLNLTRLTDPPLKVLPQLEIYEE